MRFETLDQWLDWQSSLHPREIELGLSRVTSVWRRLCPEGLDSLVISVAGTNGKGSCVALLDAIYRQAGYSVGTYTSPHLCRYNERIRVNGRPVDDQALCEVFDRIDRVREGVSLTYFEFGTLAALSIFAQERPDLVILEVGLGGRLDAVNIIDADLALITTIDLDHTDWLGQDREAIGKEKAGIMRSGHPVVLGDPDMPQSLLSQAERMQTPVSLAGRDFGYREMDDGWQWWGPEGSVRTLPMPALRGPKQLDNAAAVVMACQLLAAQLSLPENAITAGLTQVFLPGRLHWLSGRPEILLDVAHNPQAISGLREAISRHPRRGGIQAVFGLLQDKDAAAITNIMGPLVSGWHLVDIPGARGQSSRELACTMRAAGIQSPLREYACFAEAFRGAQSAAGGDDLILIFGSFILVGEAMQHLEIE